MSAPRSGLRERVAAHPWRSAAVAIVLLYGPLLGAAWSTTQFSAAADAQRRIEQIMSQPPAAPPPLPVLKTFERLELVMQRDPMQPPGRSSATPQPRSVTAAASELLRFVTSYREQTRLCAVSRDGAGQLARLCVGDKIGDGTIERIDHARVTINAGGQRHVVEIDSAQPGH